MSSIYFDFGSAFTDDGELRYENMTINAISGEISNIESNTQALISTFESNEVSESDHSEAKQWKERVLFLETRKGSIADMEEVNDIQDEIDDLVYDIENYEEMIVLREKSSSELDKIIESLGFYGSFEEKSEWQGNDLHSWLYEEDFAVPIYNFIHKLDREPSDKDIITTFRDFGMVVINIEEDYYIALTGCGMDMSQLIGLAYLELDSWIPADFIGSINLQYGLNVDGEKWKRLVTEIDRQSEIFSRQFQHLSDGAKKALEENGDKK